MKRPTRASAQVTNDPLLTVQELADLLQKTPEAIYQMRYHGSAPPAVKVGRALRWRRSSVDQWLDGLSE